VSQDVSEGTGVLGNANVAGEPLCSSFNGLVISICSV
jgi:hypothetical protein